MMRRYLALLTILIVILSLVSSSEKTNPDEESSANGPGQAVNDFLNKAAHSLVYKSMAVIVLSQLDTGVKDEINDVSSEHPIGDEIGKVLKTISLVLVVTCTVSFAVVPSIMACCGVFCCCRSNNTSGMHDFSIRYLFMCPIFITTT